MKRRWIAVRLYNNIRHQTRKQVPTKPLDDTNSDRLPAFGKSGTPTHPGGYDYSSREQTVPQVPAGDGRPGYAGSA